MPLEDAAQPSHFQSSHCRCPAGNIATQAEMLINQQLARQAAEGAAAATGAAAGAGGLDVDMDGDESPPAVRLSLQLTQVCAVLFGVHVPCCTCCALCCDERALLGQ
jgi:hypothetical protein